MYDYPTVSMLSNYIMNVLNEKKNNKNESKPNMEKNTMIKNDSNSKSESINGNDIVIIGYSCRLPGGANDPDKYWNLLKNGIDVMKEIDGDRWEVEKYYDENRGAVIGQGDHVSRHRQRCGKVYRSDSLLQDI